MVAEPSSVCSARHGKEGHKYICAHMEDSYPPSNEYWINIHIKSLEASNSGSSGQAMGRQKKGMRTKIKRRMVVADEVSPKDFATFYGFMEQH